MEQQENNVIEEKETEVVEETAEAEVTETPAEPVVDDGVKNVAKKSNKLLVTIAAGVAGVAVVAGAIIAVVAGSNSSDDKVKYAFNTMGGTEISAVDIKVGEEYTLPIPQAREGYSFDGWYTSETFEGEPVTSVVAQADQTYYAKWTQLSKITLELDEGELSVTTLYLKAGANLYEFMQSYVPVKSGLTFGAWFNGSNVLSETAKMPQDGVTLTAKYKVNYTVQFYVQTLDGTAYELDTEATVTGSDYVGLNYTSSVTLPGCTENTTYADRIVTKELSKVASDNVFKHYFDRQTFTVTFVPNQPTGVKSEDQVLTKKYGEMITVPDDETAEGYCLIGWSSSPTAKVPEYAAYYVDKALQNATGADRESASFTPTSNLRLYGVWAKGHTDMFNSDDYLFFLEKTEDGEIDESIIYLSRGNLFFKGEYDKEFNEFYFYGENDKVILTGKLYENEKFAYISSKRNGKIVYLYSVGVGLEENVKIVFDEINGVTYIVDGDETVGTQQVNDEGEYVADFTSATEGSMAGKTLTFLLGKYDGQDAFIPLKEEERDLGTLKRFYYDATEKTLKTYVNGFGDITLDGYGNATYNSGSQISSYYYSYEDGVITLNSQYGGLFGKATIMKNKGETGYVLYTQWQDTTFTVADGTLELDGGIKAVYTKNGTALQGYYTVTDSMFGGYIIKVDTDDGQKFTFMVSDVTFDDDGNLKDWDIKSVLNSYAEYRYLAEGKVYNAAAIVLDETEAGRLSLYGYNSRLTEFVKVSEGPYAKSSDNENDPYYQYTVEKTYGSDGIITTPVDPSKVKSFVFALDSATTAYSLFYWESSVSTDEPPVETHYVVEYECATEEEASLKLVGGFAYYTFKDGADVVSVSGAYGKPEEDKNYIVILTSSIAGNVSYYVELDEDNKTFIPLEYAPYTAYLYDGAGKLQNGEEDGVSLFFDGKGNAVYTKADGSTVSGKVVTSDVDKTDNAFISTFTADDNSLTFKYISGLSVGDYNVFLQYNEDYAGSFDYYKGTQRVGSLELDGFGFYGKYLYDGNTYEGRYVIPEENVIRLSCETGETFYFDVVERTSTTEGEKTVEKRKITVRAEEYGEYVWIKNRDWQQETFFELNGYGKLSVYTKTETTGANDEVTYTKNYIDENGTYEKDGDVYILRYVVDGTPKALYGELGSYQNVKAFLEKLEDDDPVIGVYVNEKDWSVLILDSVGNAIKYAGEEDDDVEAGQKEVGYYTLITENLLYFINARNTDACLYEYDTTTYTATQVKFEDTRYFTAEMETLTFYKYGFLTVVEEDGTTTRHYYKENYDETSSVKEVVSLTIYVSDPDNDDANAYGFIEKTLTGGYSEELEFEGKDYFKNAVDTVILNRAEADKENYPIISGTNKYYFTDLKFEATQEVEFEAKGKVTYAGNEYDCTVVREKNEAEELVTYVVFNDYRFFIEFDYKGVAEDFTTESTYTITSMEFHQKSYARNFLDNYAYYAGFGYQIENTLGEIIVHGSYKANGDAENVYVDAEFLENSSVKDTNGNLIKFENATYVDHGNGTYGQHYEAIFTAEDGVEYSLHFTVEKHSMVSAYAFNVLALTRRQTFGEATDEYQIETERVMYSEYSSYEQGDLFNVALKKNGEKLAGEPLMGRNDIIQIVEGNIFFAARTKATDSDKYVSTTYYMLSLVGDPVIENTDGTVEIPAYTSAEVVTTLSIDTIVYSDNGKFFVEFIGDMPAFLCMAQETFVASEEPTEVAPEDVEEKYLPTDGSTIAKAYIVKTATNGREFMVQLREKTVEETTVTYVYVQEIFE